MIDPEYTGKWESIVQPKGLNRAGLFLHTNGRGMLETSYPGRGYFCKGFYGSFKPSTEGYEFELTFSDGNLRGHIRTKMQNLEMQVLTSSTSHVRLYDEPTAWLFGRADDPPNT